MGRSFRRKFRSKATGAIVFSKTWTIEYYDGSGRQYREPAKTTKKEAADALLRKREQSVWEGTFFPDKKRQQQLTMEKLRDLWIEDHGSKRDLAHDKTRLGAAVAHFGEHRLLSTVTSDDVAEWRRALEKELATATVNRHLAVLRSALNHARERGYNHRNPMAGIELGEELNGRNRICSPEEYAKLRDGAAGDLRLAIIIGYWNGMRLGEIIGLTRDRVDVKARTIRMGGSTKEGDTKLAPLPKEAVAEIGALPARLSGRLFAYNRDTYSHQFAGLCGELGINGLHFHDLRHTALTNMADAGVDIMTMAAISGHKTLAMLKRYVHRRPSALRKAMEATEAHAATRDRS